MGMDAVLEHANQRELALACGVSPQAVSRWKASGQVPQEHLERIHELTGLTYAQILGLPPDHDLGALAEPRPGRRSRKDIKRERVLDALLELLVAGEVVQFRNLATRSGVSSATIQKYFGTREQLLFAGLHRALRLRTRLMLRLPDDLVEAGIEVGRFFGAVAAPIKRLIVNEPTLADGIADIYLEDFELAEAYLERHGLAVSAKPWMNYVHAETDRLRVIAGVELTDDDLQDLGETAAQIAIGYAEQAKKTPD